VRQQKARLAKVTTLTPHRLASIASTYSRSRRPPVWLRGLVNETRKQPLTSQAIIKGDNTGDNDADATTKDEPKPAKRKAATKSQAKATVPVFEDAATAARSADEADNAAAAEPTAGKNTAKGKGSKKADTTTPEPGAQGDDEATPPKKPAPKPKPAVKKATKERRHIEHADVREEIVKTVVQPGRKAEGAGKGKDTKKAESVADGKEAKMTVVVPDGKKAANDNEDDEDVEGE
jgi:hypothetical protein